MGVALIIAMTAGGWAWKQQQTLADQQSEIEQKGQAAQDALDKFQKSEAEKVSLQVDNILQRAQTLKNRGYTEPYQAMLTDAQRLLEGYQENLNLVPKKQEVERLLKE